MIVFYKLKLKFFSFKLIDLVNYLNLLFFLNFILFINNLIKKIKIINQISTNKE